ncbi:mannosyltransferase family protein [Phreatobacter oligotrophus]|uniref:Mannosyltransferase PIG-V n=1 Tax=Phreatobacter oligotrophus TaxID=1122261 RepID=A0A2T4YX79_9HYPH|nr:mannosyltransferase family protein [Phreatobacter oligotrophus]PTM50440.1 mannosyltransferase PIG-V [Phreatobacter oligotrophus]
MTPVSDSPAASGLGAPSLPDRIAALALAHPVATAILIFAASRVVVWLGVIFADIVIAPRTGPGLWSVGEYWFHRLLRWDAGWYMSIVREGYRVGATPQAEASIVFFPLLPMLARGLSVVTGLRGFDALLVVGNLASLAAVGLLAALVRPVFGPKVAILSAAILAFTPTSVFLSSAYTEQVTLVLVLLMFLAMARGWFWAAALAAGLATAARLTSVAATAALVAQVVLAGAGPVPRRLVLGAALGLVGIGGLLAFMAWQAWVFGDPLAFLRGQEAWSGALGAGQRLWRVVTLRPILSTNGGVPWFLVFTALVVIGAWRLPWTWTLYGALALAIPYLTVATGLPGLGSMPRYVLIVFPAMVTAALLLEHRPRLTLAVLAAGAIGLFVITARFSGWHWAG